MVSMSHPRGRLLVYELVSILINVRMSLTIPNIFVGVPVFMLAHPARSRVPGIPLLVIVAVRIPFFIVVHVPLSVPVDMYTVLHVQRETEHR